MGNRISQRTQKNVLVIMTDQHQADALGCVDPSYETPNLDELARKGVRFAEAYCASGQCTPSRAAMMAGQYPHELGVLQIGHALPPGAETVGKVFERSGYQTAYFGKWHLYASLQDHGFQVTDYATDGISHGAIDPLEDSRQAQDARATAQLLNYLDGLDLSRPFLAVISWHAPHPPFRNIPPYSERISEQEMPIPPSYRLDDLASKPAWQQARAATGESRLTEAIVRADAKAYRSQVAYADWNVGRILDVLQRKGVSDNTVVAFTADHGDMQGAHRLRLKGVVPYQELYRVPLVLFDPEANNGRVSTHLVSTVSLPATLLSCAGLESPPAYSGPSLRPLLDSATAPWDDRVFIQHWRAYWGFHPFVGVVTPEWKFVTYLLDQGEAELYSRVDDPLELHNRAHDPRYGAVRGELLALVREWWHGTGGLSVAPLRVRDGTWDTTISTQEWATLTRALSENEG